MAVPVITSLNPLEDNITFQKTTVSNKFYSSKLLNYVESVEIAGFRKTVFYTEYNTNFNVGDRVFIVNGNYDSNNFILQDKYTKYTDGYRVLGCDGCRLIIDLDYTGDLPYIQNSINSSIKVYHVRNQREFDYLNSIRINQNAITFTFNSTLYTIANTRLSKFAGNIYGTGNNSTAILFSDSILYVPQILLGSSNFLNRNSGVPTSGFSQGFYVRNDLAAIPTWVNITNEVLNNRVIIVNPSYSDVEKKLYIKDEDFILNSIEFKKNNVYTFDSNNWEINLRYRKPYISRLNFRFGRFSGKHQDGIFGTNLKKNNWNSATWNSGSIVNTNWNSGSLNSKSSAGEQLYFSTFSPENLTPVQTLDFTNNRGFGLNFLEDCNILTGEIKNGNFENCNIGIGTTYSALDIYFGLSYSFPTKINGLFRKCDIDNVISTNSKIVNSRVFNSNLKSTNLVNSQIYKSSAYESVFDDEEGITVLSSDLWAYNTDPTQTDTIRGILKLYISDSDAEKILDTDAFYLTRINKGLFLTSLSGDDKIKLPIETKYILDIYNDFELENERVIVTVNSKNDNRISCFVNQSSNNFRTTFGENTGFNFASIDIESRVFAWYNRRPVNSSIGPNSQQLVPTYIGGKLTQEQFESINNFLTFTYIRNSDFKSGYFDKSFWKSGAKINYKHHVIPNNNGNLNVGGFGNDILSITLNPDRLSYQNIFGEDLLIDDTVWLDDIDEVPVGTGPIKSIAGRYRVINIINDPLYERIFLKSLDGLLFSSFAFYKTIGAENQNYVSLSTFRISKSTIKSGLLVRTSLKDSTTTNDEFDNTDKILDITNIERLRLINILFKNSNNKINAGYVHKSHFINDIWNNGIIFNSVWNTGTFSNGIFNSGYWIMGNFKSGSFINSKDITSTTQSYDTNQSTLYRTWLTGTFDSGEFFNSTWMNGTFNNGRFYNSEWFAGTWNNGILGSNTLQISDTKMAYSAPLPQSGTVSYWNNGSVENGILGGSGSILWKTGKFNDGEFTSFGSSNTNQSIWYDGEFNNGKFSGLARWKNGKFFKGKFHSYYGYTYSRAINPSTYSTSYGWENGKFLGGEFGNASTGTNSVWYDGQFSGNTFQGRFWYKGLFIKGEFLGSGSGSTIYNTRSAQAPWNLTSEYNFAQSFTNSYYGLWYSGVVSDNPKNIRTEERVFTELVRKSEEIRVENPVLFSNSLWLDGTFSHKSGVFQNSLWLKGFFYDGTFDSSIFNPYVDRTFNANPTPSFASTQSCIWYNGKFDSTLGTGSFFISDWMTGTFNKGFMSGATWRKGVWNYGFADNILWLDGLWRNGNWNGAPFDVLSIDRTSAPTYSMLSGRSSDIMINVGVNLDNLRSIYLNNIFSASVPVYILTDPSITSLNFSTSSVFSSNNEQYNDVLIQTSTSVTNTSNILNNQGLGLSNFRDCSQWQFGTTYSLNSTSVVTDSHVFTTGGDVPQFTGLQIRTEPPSSKLFAVLSGSINIFSLAETTYVIKIEISVEDYPQVDVFIGLGNNQESKFTLQTTSEIVSGRTIYNPKRYVLSFVYRTPIASILNAPILIPTNQISKQFYIRKGMGGNLRVLYIDIQKRDYEYHPEYNNSVVTNSINFNTGVISLPSGSEVEVLGVSTDANLVSTNVGNGLFKSGIWENGIWNNGFRSNEFVNEQDYYRFLNIVGLNGIFPYAGKGTYQTGANTWLVTLQSLDSLDGLNLGDKVAIGNLVAIDINESRKLIKDYFTIVQIDNVNNTIVVELVSNFPIIRVERDSSNHIIYVTKNVWLTGAFLNGVFRGVWNNGLFKSYPRIGVLVHSQWIDGKIDGGRIISKTNTLLGFRYNTTVIQKFIFMDNNSSNPTLEAPKYTTWADLNFDTQVYTTINKESSVGRLESYPPQNTQLPGVFTYSVITDDLVNTSVYLNNSNVTQSTNLQGLITNDVLESDSSFKHVDNSIYKYKLGTKYTIYQNFIPNDGNFLEPFSNNLGYGIDMNEFVNDGWTYSDFSQPFFATSSSYNPTFSFVTTGSNLSIDSNISSGSSNLAGQMRVKSANFLSSSVVILWIFGNYLIDFRFIKFVLNNDNIITERNRYFFTKVDVQKLLISTASFNWNGSSTYVKNLNLAPNINDYTEYNGNVPISKTQYFYNKKNLSLNLEVYTRFLTVVTNTIQTIPGQPPILNDNSLDVIFNNISFYEVDMIPFFNYYGTESNIDTRIKTPWFAVAPIIDYTDSNFDFLGNVNLTIDSDLVNNQIDYAIISVGGVNGNVSTPGGGIGGGVISISVDE
jgi:hypothetical protein